jgi:F0F1-type ATP synthase assembly protein I
VAKKEITSTWRALSLATNLGLTMAVFVFLGYYAGHYLDQRLLHGPRTPWLTMVFSLLGVVVGFRSVFVMIKSLYDQDK